MSVEPDPIAVTLLVTQLFDELQIPYVVVGSLASSYYGVSRSSLDSDIVTNLSADQVPALIDRLGSDFYVDELAARGAVQNRGSFNLVHRPTMFRVDIFVSKQRPFDQAQFKRGRVLKLDERGNRMTTLASAEDTILGKLEWFRLGNDISDRQWQDVLGILRVQKDELDLDLLQDWASKIGVSDLLSKALKEAETND